MDSNSEYSNLLNILAKGEPILDLLHEKFGYFPVTFGRVDENGNPLDTVLTFKKAQTF